MPSILKRSSPGKTSPDNKTSLTQSSPTCPVSSALSPILPKLTSPIMSTSPPTLSNVATAPVTPIAQNNQICLVSSGFNQFQVVQDISGAATANVQPSNSSFVALKTADGSLHMVPQSLFEGNQHLASVGVPVQLLQQPPQQQLQVAMPTVVTQPLSQIVLSSPQKEPVTVASTSLWDSASGSNVIPQNAVTASNVPDLIVSGHNEPVKVQPNVQTVSKEVKPPHLGVSVSLGVSSTSTRGMNTSSGDKKVSNKPSVPTSALDNKNDVQAGIATGNIPVHIADLQCKSVSNTSTTQLSRESCTSYKRKVFNDNKSKNQATSSQFNKKPRLEVGVKTGTHELGPTTVIPAIGSMQDDIRRRLYAARYKAGLVPKGYDEIKKKPPNTGQISHKVRIVYSFLMFIVDKLRSERH